MQPSFYNHLCKFKSATFLFRVAGCYLSSGYLVVSSVRLGFFRFRKRGRLVLKSACPFVSSVFVVSVFVVSVFVASVFVSSVFVVSVFIASVFVASVFIASVFVASVFIASEVRPSSAKRKYAVPPPDEVRQESLRQALRTPQ